MKQRQKISFTTKMIGALLAALIVSVLCIALREHVGVHSPLWQQLNNIFFQDITQENSHDAIGLFFIIGKLFLNTVQIVLVPLVCTSIVLAMTHVKHTKTLATISRKTLWAFFSLTVLALLLAASVGYTSYLCGAFTLDLHIPLTHEQTATTNNPLLLILNIIPNNLVLAFGNNNAILSLVFISVSLGLCINALGEKITVLKKLIVEINQIAMTFLTFVITKVGPFAIFALLVKTFASYGLDYLQPAAIYVTLVIPTLLVFLLIIMPLYVKATTKLHPLVFLKKTMQVAVFGFSTSSSAATLPLNTKVCNEHLGIDDDITAFVVPLGTAMNKTGTAITQVIATLFIAGVAGYTVSPVTLLVIIVLVFITSISTPAIPGAGAIVLFTILSGVGMTNETALVVYSLILAINPPVEMLSTALNVVNDTVSALAVAKSEGLVDEAIYYTGTEQVQQNIKQVD
jgi:Na+/H+-dicarboxylate symporter